MNFKAKLTTAFFLLVLTPMSIMAVLFYSSTRSTIRYNIYNHLQAINELKVEQYENWVQGKADKLRNFASRPLVPRYTELMAQVPDREYMDQVLKFHTTRSHSEDPITDSKTLPADPVNGNNPFSVSWETAHELLHEDHLEPVSASDPDFVSIFIMNAKNGMILVSSDPEDAGKNREVTAYFRGGLKGPFIQGAYYSPSRDRPFITISHPLISDRGEVVGVVAAHLNLEKLSDVILTRNQLYKTEESYIVNHYNMMVTRSRFEQGSLLTRAARSEGIDRALHQGQTGVLEYRNYRGDEVMGAFASINEADLAVVTEIELDEALEAVDRFTWQFGSLLAIFLLIASSASAYFLRSLSKPIQSLMEGTEAFGSGNMNHRIAETGVTEFKRLAESFNNMIERHQKSDEEIRKLGSLVEAAGQGLGMADMDGRIIYVNKALLRMIGKSDYQDALGTSFKVYYPPEFQKKLDEVVIPKVLERGWWKGEMALGKADGSVSPTLENFFTIPDDKGNPACLAAVITDITQLKEAEEELRQHRDNLEKLVQERTAELLREKSFIDSVIDSLPGIFYVIDENGCFEQVNRNFERVTEYTGKEILKMSPLDFFCKEEKMVIKEAIQKVFNTGEAQIEGSLQTKTGKKIPYYLTGVRALIGGNNYLVGVGLDISEQKKAESALQNTFEELERSNEELQQFAYVASHDLKEPLRMVSSYLQLFEKRYGESVENEGREFLDFASDGAVRMAKLIDDLLLFSRVRTEVKDFEPVHTEEVLQTVVEDFTLSIQESGARLTFNGLPTVMGDRTQLGQLLSNLIGNAIKFKSDKIPEISISAERDGPFWKFAVADNGIGIDPKHFEKIFIIFKRLHDRGKYPGTGIGLALCRRIVSVHGGKFWVDSQPGEGATFYFTLPGIEADA